MRFFGHEDSGAGDALYRKQPVDTTVSFYADALVWASAPQNHECKKHTTTGRRNNQTANCHFQEEK